MTQLLSAAFDYTVGGSRQAEKRLGQGARRGDPAGGRSRRAGAVARGRADASRRPGGVNAFIRGIDRLGNGRLPAAVIMCTNRLGALDPAVKRRAADILIFERPERRAAARGARGAASSSWVFAKPQIERLVAATGGQNGRAYGFTFSDLTQRLLPAIVLDAYPSTAVDPARALEIAEAMTPTPPFQETTA